MVGLVVPVLIAVCAAIVLGGSLERWAAQRIRWWPLAACALGIQLPLYSPPFNGWPAVASAAAVVGIVTMGLALVVVVRNAVGPIRAACLLAALGIALNLGAMLANGGEMPRAEELAVLLGDGGVHREMNEVSPSASNTAPMTSQSRLVWLADVIPEPAWFPRANLVSVGDLLLTLGATWWTFVVTLGPRSPRRTPKRPVAL